MNEKIKRKAHVKQSFSLDFLERGTFTEYPDVLQLVAKYPYMYKATSVPNIRVFHCDYFKVYYRVLEKQILVEAVFDTRQDPDKAPF